MPDWNPDREGHRQHSWVVHKANTNFNFKNVVAADKVIPFNREGRFMVKDEAVANEIRKNYPRAVTVTRVHTPHPMDRGHRYFFSCPAMPWHKEEE